MMERLRDVVARIDGRDRELVELLAVATASGDLPAFRAEVERGVALEAATPDGVEAEALREGVRGLRRRHGLLSRTELRQWLATHGMEADDLSGVARRSLLRAGDDGRALPQPAPETVAPVLWAELVCSGKLRDFARPLALGVAAERRIGPAPAARADDASRVDRMLADDRATGLASLDSGERRILAERACALVIHGGELLRQSVDALAVVARCRERALDWRMLELEELRVPHEGAAREALLQVRGGESDLAGLAQAYGFAYRRVAQRPEERPEAVAALRSAATGDLLGPAPAEAGAGCVVLRVVRASSAGEDPALRPRAVRELHAEAAERFTAGLVSWRGAA